MVGHEVRLRGRRVVTLLGAPRHFRTLVRSLDTATPRRRAVRAALLTTTTTRTTALVSRSVDASEDELASLLAPVTEATRGGVRAAMVVWPAGDRSHRRYLAATDDSGELVAFAKVSIQPALDASSFRTERLVLEELERSPLPAVRAPRVLAAVDTPAMTALVMEAIPAMREHLTWDEVIGLLPLTQSSDAAPPAQDDLARTAASLHPSPSFADAVAAGLRVLRTSTANGDMRPSNVVRAGGDVWVFDWEFGSDRAPAATDLVSAVLTRRVESESAPDPEMVLIDVLADLRARGVADEEAAVAILYLASTGQPWASTLVKGRWPSPSIRGRRTPAP